MGIYLNPEPDKFIEAINSPIYVDKSELICYTNSVLRTKQKYICVSRPRQLAREDVWLSAFCSKKGVKSCPGKG